MKLSHRAKRMDRRHKRSFVATVNLVSLMDIFTILVFFLLVNSSNSAQLPNQKTIKLPESNAQELPHETLVIMVNNTDILVNGHLVANVADVMRMPSDTIPALQKELQFQASKAPAPRNPQGQPERQVTIMGDRAIPYKLLRKIMLTCSNNEYTSISLAVLRKPEDKPS